jgi:hypothetical protein
MYSRRHGAHSGFGSATSDQLSVDGIHAKPVSVGVSKRIWMHIRLVMGAAVVAALGLFTVPAGGRAHPTPPAAAPEMTHLSPARAERFPIIGSRAGAERVLRKALGQRVATSRAASSAARAEAVGETRNWLALDTEVGYYRKGFTLRAVGPHVEIWVASEANVRAPAREDRPIVGRSTALQYLDGDCRNGVRTQVTDAQVNQLLNAFESNIYPKESSVFSVPPGRSGSRNLLSQVFTPAEVAQFNPIGDPNHLVVLVDNIRDESFYDLNNVHHFGYIGGFFSPVLNEVFDRNIMNVDGFDWLHRTGANPPDEPKPGDFCNSAPARPYDYEGTFAHEYQHLLEYYVDPDEFSWVNEGLSDWAQSMTGYVDTSRPITDNGFDAHIQAFLGWLLVRTPANPNPVDHDGPENSLTAWIDQGDDEILSDYGATYAMMEYLDGRYGPGFMTALHRASGNGLAGLQQTLRGAGRRESSAALVREWSLMVAVDGLLDSGMTLRGADPGTLSTRTLGATINWDARDAYSRAGAPPNGSDYVRLRGSGGSFLSGSRVRSLVFNGASTHTPTPIAWRVAAKPPGRGNPALYSGTGDERDEAIVRLVTVPRGNARLTFDAAWNLEAGYDYAFVQVSTNRGRSYRSLSCTGMTTQTARDVAPEVTAALPGYTDRSQQWRRHSCSLSRYAGRKVHIAFRTFNDPFVQGNPNATIPPGFWVDNIRVGTRTLSTGGTLAGWRSTTQVRRLRVTTLTVRLLSISTAAKTVTVRTLKLNKQHDLSVRRNLGSLVDPRADFVAAIVTYDEPVEKIRQYARYRLVVNGVRQPGG